ncbi:myosin-11 isoform X2 [Vigna radiata var. radiata]|uniref:Myosin-11 isoform X2 n=1 Tax=Vigna radiata var. radiata TaxID=3916 RepID=A0A3Q0F975_VIGRR|nr:myosin-11 isoform X2 [Vigna radiata var. radiata]
MTCANFKDQEVPKGWDKLFVSVVSAENGKTIAKSSKVPVRNGGCQWSDSFSESIWVSRDNSSKEIDDFVLKLIVAMGSSRSGILGDATVSLTSYMSSDAAIPLSIPLNKCNHGTTLQVTVQCLTPRTKHRDQDTNFHLKASNENNYDLPIKSNESDYSNIQSVESSSVEDFDSILSPGEIETRATSFSGSVSNCSHYSTEGSTGRENISSSISDGQSPTGIQGSASSQKSVSHHDYPVNSSQSNDSSFVSQNIQEIGSLYSKTTNASNNRLEPAEDTTEELRAEAKMWEMNARKLMGDLDVLRKEFSDQYENLAGIKTELSAAQAERDSLKKEVEKLKLSSEDPRARKRASDDSLCEGECFSEVENALKEELKFEKESNANWSLQLKRSQEANLELVSVLQELEETIEQQKIEIETLSSLPSKFSDLDQSFQVSTQENKQLMQQLEQLEESKKNLLVKVQELEDALEDKMRDTAHLKIQNNKTLSDIEMEYEGQLVAKDEEILSLKAKLSESVPESCNVETVSKNLGDADLLREIELLKEKVQELEVDCNELTEENLDLLFKLKEANKSLKDGGASQDLLSDKVKDQCSTSFGSEISNNLFRIFRSGDMVQGENNIKISDNDHVSIQELETSKLALEVRITDLNTELTNKSSEIGNLEANLSNKEKEIGVLQKLLDELEAKVYHLEQEHSQHEKDMEAMKKENKHELELIISEIEQERQQLSTRISVLEAQLRDLTNEREFHLTELENSRSKAARLQEKIMEMQTQIDSSTEDLEQKLKVTQFRWSEAQEECEYLRVANRNLQNAIENLTEECSFFKKINGDLRQEKLKEQENCSLMGARLRESDERFAKCSERVEHLEQSFTLMQEDIASEMKHLISDLDVLFDENRKQMEQGEVLLNQMQMEKMVETQNLELEVENLRLKLSAAYDEKERIASNALLEVSTLRADKAKLESASEEAQSKVILAQNEVDALQSQYEQKLKDVTNQLAEYKIKVEMLTTEHEKLLKLVEDSKSRELKFKSTINALELKLTVTEYERQQIMDESGNLKVKLQQNHQLENENIALKNELNASKSEKERLEETRCVQDTDLSNSRRINRQHQQTIQLLEQEKAEFQTKAQALEEELKLIKEQKRNQVSKLNRKSSPVHDDLKSSKNLGVKNNNQHRINRKKSLKNDSIKHYSEVETELGLDENVHAVEVDPLSKTQLCDNELAKANEANNNYEARFHRSPSRGQKIQANGPLKSMAEEVVTKEKFERIKSVLEADLRDIQERYFHMSLKYAEVEAEREELVMKLKATKNKKGWLS